MKTKAEWLALAQTMPLEDVLSAILKEHEERLGFLIQERDQAIFSAKSGLSVYEPNLIVTIRGIVSDGPLRTDLPIISGGISASEPGDKLK